MTWAKTELKNAGVRSHMFLFSAMLSIPRQFVTNSHTLAPETANSFFTLSTTSIFFALSALLASSFKSSNSASVNSFVEKYASKSFSCQQRKE